MEGLTEYTQMINNGIEATISRLIKANDIYYKGEPNISDATKALLELNQAQISGLVKIVYGQLELIKNLSEKGHFLQHELNIEALLKSIK